MAFLAQNTLSLLIFEILKVKKISIAFENPIHNLAFIYFSQVWEGKLVTKKFSFWGSRLNYAHDPISILDLELHQVEYSKKL